jgi:hypothetical protein
MHLLLLPILLLAAPQADAATGQDRADIERHCLALNIYFEARGEPLLGKIAVGHVVLNRMRDRRFPESVCDVVKQGGYQVRYRCQFTWWCDGRSDRPRNRHAWRDSVHIASLIYGQALPDPTGGALWYHADYVDPKWSRALMIRAKLGAHIFYTDPGAKADAVKPHKASKCLPGTLAAQIEAVKLAASAESLERSDDAKLAKAATRLEALKRPASAELLERVASAGSVAWAGGAEFIERAAGAGSVALAACAEFIEKVASIQRIERTDETASVAGTGGAGFIVWAADTPPAA